MITSIGQIHISVTDIDTAVAFYRDTLGLTFLFDVPAQQMAFFDAGGVRLYLGVAETPEFSSHPLLYFTVDDITQEHARLVAAGVEFLGDPHPVHRTETSELWMAFFRDPEKHVLAIMQERPVS